uniref:Cytochrome b5 domain-containing protein 1 n=1 Tax=Acanthochromis polyacanthus TaxID=80966 RepID=A0A3Q1F2P6_9TELE
MGRPKFFTPSEVAAHNSAADIWVSFLGKVFDLSPLMDRHGGDVLMLPIMEAAGKDISHWFDPETKDIQTYVDPQTCCLRYYTPRGRFLHVPPTGPRSDWTNDFGEPWWKDQSYQVGRLSSKTRWIRIINMLTSQEQRLEVYHVMLYHVMLYHFMLYRVMYHVMLYHFMLYRVMLYRAMLYHFMLYHFMLYHFMLYRVM